MPSKKLLIALVTILTLPSAFPTTVALRASRTDQSQCSVGGGVNPYAGLIFDTAGNLFGTTLLGGRYHDGSVFELTPGANGKWNKTSPHTFDCTDGAYPYAGLISDAAGNLYGTTEGGGRRNFGNVFALTPSADGKWTKTLLHTFTGKDGAQPFSTLIFDSAGNLYGTTYGGGSYLGGVVFKLAPGANGKWTETVLYSFHDDGESPTSGLIFDSAGNLYGAAAYGALGYGSIFQLTSQADGTWKETMLHAFDRKDGMWPYASSRGEGTVFKLTPGANDKWTETVLHIFYGSQ